jgi:putative ABC transport system substrate-binding protein
VHNRVFILGVAVNSQRRRLLAFGATGLAATVLASLSCSKSEQRAQIPRVGFLSPASPTAIADRVEGFRQGLQKLGYQEGKNIVVEYRYADGSAERLAALAAELVGLKVEVVVTHGEAAIKALERVSRTIPIVVGVTGDLVEVGHAASLARPGGHITGFVDTSPELSGKRLEILKEVYPTGTRIGVIWNGDNPIKVLDFKETESAARALGLTLVSVKVGRSQNLQRQLAGVIKQSPQAILVLQDALTIENAQAIVDFARANRLPAMYGSSEFVDIGGLMSYGANFSDLFRAAAAYVDKILKGGNVGDLPIEQPMKFDLVVNLKVAHALDLAMPREVMVKATRVLQ